MQFASALLFLGIIYYARSVFGQTDPGTITVSVSNLYPEGIEYSTDHGFFLSSTTMGSIYTVMDDGSAKVFSNDSRLTSTRGLHIDPSRNELLVCNNQSLVRINLATSNVNNFIDLRNYTRLGYNGTIMPNDVVSDGQGNAYVTDSRGNVIWVVDGSSTPSIFVQDKRWYTSGNAVGLNGIEYISAQNVLLVGHTATSSLYKVDVSTSAITMVTTPKLTGIDGLVLRSDGSLVVVGNSAQLVYLLQSSDGWNSAAIVHTFASQYPSPTTATICGSSVYVCHAYFNVANQKDFQIEQVVFDADVERKVDTSTAGWIILSVILVMGIVCGVAFGVAVYIRKRQQRYQQMELPTNEFDDTRGRSLSLPEDEYL